MRRMLPPTLLLCSLLLAVRSAAQTPAPAPAASPAPAAAEDPRAADPAVAALDALIDRIDVGAGKLRDATYIFYRTEYIEGKLHPEEKIAVKHRFPHDIYMKWVGSQKTGREVLHKSGWNEGKIRVSLGSMTPTLNLDPRGSMAMDGERHSIFDLGPVRLTQLIVRDAKRIRANPALVVKATDQGKKTWYGESTSCVSAELPKAQDPKLYAHKMNLCVSDRHNVPLWIELYDVEDGALRMIERYGYENLKVNVGLTDADFSPDHADYGF